MQTSALHFPVVWFGVIVVAVAAVVIAIKKRSRSRWGFKEVLKNPAYWDGLIRSRHRVDSAVKAARSWDDDRIASVTRQFVLEATSSQEASDQARILSTLGERTHPAVLGLLRDASLYNRLVKPTREVWVPEAPFNRACDLLGDSPGTEAVEALAPFLSDPSEGIRKDAALAIAKTGAATITPLVRKALSDQQESVAEYALMGLEFALTRSRLSDGVRADLVPDVLDLLRTARNADNAADILYRLDSSKATDYFLSQKVFTVESPILHEVLKVLANRVAPVPRSELQALIASLEMRELKYPKNYALGEALRLLGQQQREEDRDFLRSRMSHREKFVAEGAASGVLASFGLDGFKQRLRDAERRSGYESLAENQRLYLAVYWCNAQINNGGLAQYFVNPHGDKWRDALAGFRAMGFQERLAVLNDAVNMFGDTGPSTDWRVRQIQLSKLCKRDDATFDALSTRYYQSSEVVEVFASHFVLANPESFRTRSGQEHETSYPPLPP